MTKVAPSVLSADFARLGAEIDDIVSAGADYIHFDVMDGVFVPNISIGIPVLKSLRKITDAVIDAHLMIVEPIHYVEKFCDAGADIVNIHVEADIPDNIDAALDAIRAKGKKAGLTVKPATPVSAVLPYLDKLDLVLVMTVEPGFSGQSFMPEPLSKIAALREEIDCRGLSCEIEVDGGVNGKTAVLCKNAGADVLVSGSFVFDSPDRAERIQQIKNA